MKCPKCGFEIPVGARFCARCGLQLAAPVPPPTSEPAQVVESVAPAEPAVPQPEVPETPVYTPPQPPVPPPYEPQDISSGAPYPPPAEPGAYPYKMPVQPAQPKKGPNPILFILIGVGAVAVLVTIGIILFTVLFGSKKDTDIGAVSATHTPEPIVTVTPEPSAEAEPTPTAEPTAEPTPEPTPEPTAAPSADSEYILPQSSTRKLTYDDISHLTHDEMVLARNEIFARHGRCFDTDWIREYFEQQSWYNGTIPASSFSKSLLSSIEVYNVNFLKANEDSAPDTHVTNQTAANNASGTYAEVIQAAIDAIPSPMSKYYSGGGALYDLTGDGVDELLMVYFTKSSPGYPESCVFSVYTMENGMAKALLHEELLYMAAGGPDGELNVMLKDGAVYLGARKSDWNPTDDNYAENPGYWNMYKVVGPTIIADIRVDYCEREIDGAMNHAESTAVIDGTSVSYEEYVVWRDSFDYVLSIDDYDPGITLPALLDIVS